MEDIIMQREMYERKRAFIEALSEALASAGLVKSIEYKRMPAHYSEYVKVEYAEYDNEAYDYINVTADSHKAMFLDIARLINRQPPIGQVIDAKYKGVVDQWWNENERRDTSDKTAD